MDITLDGWIDHIGHTQKLMFKGCPKIKSAALFHLNELPGLI